MAANFFIKRWQLTVTLYKSLQFLASLSSVIILEAIPKFKSSNCNCCANILETVESLNPPLPPLFPPSPKNTPAIYASTTLLGELKIKYGAVTVTEDSFSNPFKAKNSLILREKQLTT